jgi:hypothetical protein
MALAHMWDENQEPSARLFWVVTAHRASGLQDRAYFSAQDPFVEATLGLSTSDEAVCVRCKTLIGGGQNPTWDGMRDDEGYSIGNAIVLGVPVDGETSLPAERRQSGWTTLKIKVWNDSVVADLIGSVTITIGANEIDLDYSRGHRSWYALKPQGKVELTLHRVKPLASEDMELDMRVQRGPGWKYGDQDGGMLKLADHEDEVRDRHRISSRTIDSAHPTLEAKLNDFANVISISNESDDEDYDPSPNHDSLQEEFTFGPFRCGTVVEVRNDTKSKKGKSTIYQYRVWSNLDYCHTACCDD